MFYRVKRIFSEKKKPYNNEANFLLHDIRDVLGIKNIENIRVVHRYDIEGISRNTYLRARNTIFSEPPLDFVYDEVAPFSEEEHIFGWEYLPGQYDQRADSAAQAIQILTHGKKPIVKSATLIAIKGNITDEEFNRIKNYVINPVDSRECSMEKPKTLRESFEKPFRISIIKDFIKMSKSELQKLHENLGLAMDMDDLIFCQSYFMKEEKRDPTLTEIRIIDTYWSDHCRHTTFMTEIESIELEEGSLKREIESAYHRYLESRKKVYGEFPEKNICLMDIATIAMKEMKKNGVLDNLEESEEINACSIVVPVKINGQTEEWLVMFKNETHNHPTEIEPFGGAATCIGGAIRDPLSGRSYVYQAMRVTGSGDPRRPLEETLPGKLPQRKITRDAAHGYSSYGNQIGLATGLVAEIYDEGYVAKRMEIGAVIGAAPRKNVLRGHPEPGDVVILLGGRTGRDGCGGATGSSKIHTEKSLTQSGAEVQKGNAPEERKIQRLFRKREVATLIKKCNDFGAGGVSVAVGELADGIRINLDLVPKKYEGLDGTELAISESQERMAVLTPSKNANLFIKEASKENLEATIIAEVTKEKFIRMFWKGREIVHLSREFLNSNGAKKHTKVFVSQPKIDSSPFVIRNIGSRQSITEKWFKLLEDINIASQKGLVEYFDSTIGSRTVVMPFGGEKMLTPAQSMVAKIPVENGDTSTATVMSFGFDPKISSWSPFHGAIYAIIESLSKITASGADYSKARLSLQEYFEKPYKNPERWGKPFSSLLGAYIAQMNLGVPAIGGKDSMSGTFGNMDVPPTLVSFAVSITDTDVVLSPEFKKAGNMVFYLPFKKDSSFLPDWDYCRKLFSFVYQLALEKKILSAYAIGRGGIAEAVSKMSFGNLIGFEFENLPDDEVLFGPGYGSFLLEISDAEKISFDGIDTVLLGRTLSEPFIKAKDFSISINEAVERWLKPLSDVFPHKTPDSGIILPGYLYNQKGTLMRVRPIARPRVIIPVFPGTNCEYDSAIAFEKAGAVVETLVFRNRTPGEIRESLKAFRSAILKSQIIMIPGGFSAGDEPEGSGKFIASVFRNKAIKDAVMELLNNRDGLILGICNGFQALIKLGLVPYGEIRDQEENSPTLTYNAIGRHVSNMVRTKVVSRLSPWFYNSEPGEIHTIPVSHGEGRFIADESMIEKLKSSGQIVTQYVDEYGNPSSDMPYNPNGSVFAVEGICSPDGRVLGKMAHSERTGNDVCINIPGNKFQKIFEAGVEYYK